MNFQTQEPNSYRTLVTFSYVLLIISQVGPDTWMVNTADTGERAIQVLESSLKLPDIIVLDQNMSSSGGKLLGHEVVYTTTALPPLPTKIYVLIEHHLDNILNLICHKMIGC